MLPGEPKGAVDGARAHRRPSRRQRRSLRATTGWRSPACTAVAETAGAREALDFGVAALVVLHARLRGRARARAIHALLADDRAGRPARPAVVDVGLRVGAGAAAHAL